MTLLFTLTVHDPQASVLAGGDYGGEETCPQPERPAAHSSLRAENRSVRLRVRQEEEEEGVHPSFCNYRNENLDILKVQVNGPLPNQLWKWVKQVTPCGNV